MQDGIEKLTVQHIVSLEHRIKALEAQVEELKWQCTYSQLEEFILQAVLKSYTACKIVRRAEGG